MIILIITQCLIIVMLILYLHIMQKQIEQVSQQLIKRRTEHTRQPVSLQFVNKKLTSLALNIDRSLKDEEQLKINTMREEKSFKEMIADLSHDLRTPLTAVKGYMQLLNRETLNQRQQGYVDIALNRTEHLEALINRFFELSCLENSEEMPLFQRINITNLISGCLADAVPLLEQSGLPVSFIQEEPVYIVGDEEMSKRNIQNLIRNCICHSSGSIYITMENAGPMNRISFRNPVDKPEAIDVQHLFDRYYTVRQNNRPGTGLGLSIVNLLARKMNGSANARLEHTSLIISVTLPAWQEDTITEINRRKTL